MSNGTSAARLCRIKTPGEYSANDLRAVAAAILREHERLAKFYAGDELVSRAMLEDAEAASATLRELAGILDGATTHGTFEKVNDYWDTLYLRCEETGAEHPESEPYEDALRRIADWGLAIRLEDL